MKTSDYILLFVLLVFVTGISYGIKSGVQQWQANISAHSN